MSENENYNIPKSAGAEETVPRREFRTVCAQSKRGDLQINNLIFRLENLDKAGRTKPKVRRKRIFQQEDGRLLLEEINNWF